MVIDSDERSNFPKSSPGEVVRSNISKPSRVGSGEGHCVSVDSRRASPVVRQNSGRSRE
jgi:hypothetical protein